MDAREREVPHHARKRPAPPLPFEALVARGNADNASGGILY